MTDTLGITIDWPTIRRQLEANGYTSMYLLVKADNSPACPPDLMDEINRAVHAANNLMVDANGNDIVWATSPLATPAGPVINLDLVTDDDADTHQWLDQFAATLSSTRAGAVTKAPENDIPRVLGNNTAPHPATYLAYSLTTPLAPLSEQSWRIADRVAEQVLSQAAAWIQESGDDTYISENAFRMLVNPADVSALLRTGIGRSLTVNATAVTRQPPAGRRVGLAYNGMVAYDILGPDQFWYDTLPPLRAQLLAHPGDLDLGIIRTTRLFARPWNSVGNSPYRLPGLHDIGEWDRNRHMWNRFVPDAHAIQILTPAHLDRANNLTDWDLTKLPGDRWLVETRDLHAWFAPGQVTDDVLAQARADFGDMIITTDDIQNDPHGWLGGPYPPARA